MTGAKLFMLLPVFVGMAVLVHVVGKVARRRRLGRHGIRTTGTVIDHVVEGKRGHILVEFEVSQGRNMLISEPRKRLDPVGDYVQVTYLADEPDNGRVPVTAFAFTSSVLGETLLALWLVALGLVLVVAA